MNKLCPFCKEQIEKSAAKCSFCKRTIIERVDGLKNVYSEKIHHDSFIKKLNIFKTAIAKQLEKKLTSLKHFKIPRHFLSMRNTIIASVILFVITILFIGSNNHIGNTLSQPHQQNENNFFYHSLPNGTVVSTMIENSNGLGELEIDNGTDYDAVAKLIDKNLKLSVFTVYIGAKSTYTIKNIEDGNYNLIFNTGNDWDEKAKKFLVNSSFAKFTDGFSYVTTSIDDYSGTHTRYATYKITLNPVVGGTAKTNDISETEFTKY